MRLLLAAASIVCAASAPASDKRLLWGDTHVHTSYSSDAYTNENLSAGPETAFRYARGMPVVHPYHGARVQIGTPLDFLVISDHAEFLGQIRHIHRNGIDTEDLGLWESIKGHVAALVLRRAIDRREGRELFFDVLPDPSLTPQEDARASSMASGDLSLLPMDSDVERIAWKDITTTAERYNDPGNFTALIGWEWSATPAGANLHRVVITDSDASTALEYSPFGFDDSPYPEDLWAWLEKTSDATGARFIAIPHNSNISKGYMFADTTLRGEPLDSTYAATRARWEPVAEITQIKGDSETHPELSPDDPFADFEQYPYYIQRRWTRYEPQPGDYVRSALKRGLQLERALGVNPYRLGVIGSTDSHTALASAEEDNFHGKLATDSIPANKQRGWRDDGAGPTGWSMSASGLAAVWARGNTREDILDALQRREVYATTGPRIAVQFFGGAGFVAETLASAGLHQLAARRGVPMGGELRQEETPSFIVIAAKDPVGANLDRIQIVKGWLGADGETREKVFDVAWSGERQVGADGQLPPVGDTVDHRTGAVDNRIGAPALQAVWTDPTFDPSQPAFYYARVLQIPTARHSLLDAIALDMESAPGKPDTIQERAYTSPIWYRPGD